MMDVVIVGSGPAGLTAAIYAKRANMEAVVIEKEFMGSGQMALSSEVSNYPGFPSISGYELGATMLQHANSVGANIITASVLEIKKIDSHFVVSYDDGQKVTQLETKTVLYAAGATHRRLQIPGEAEFYGKGVSYCAICDGAFFRKKVVAVQGGGDTAVDDALYLSNLCEKVYLIHRRKEFRAVKTSVELLQERDNIELILEDQIVEILGEERVSEIALKSGKHLFVNGVFVAIGNVPQNDLVKEFVELDASGYIIAGEDCKTTLPGFYVAGDARTKQLRQIVTAVADGANAIYEIEQYLK